MPLEALSRTLNETLSSTSFWALYVSFLLSLSAPCHIIHIEPQMVIVCSNFLFMPFLFLTNSNTCFIICNLQMGGIDEPILDTLSLIKR